MKNKAVRALLTAIAAIVLCAGCANAGDAYPETPTEPVYEYAEEYMRVSEPYGSAFFINGKTFSTAVGRA